MGVVPAVAGDLLITVEYNDAVAGDPGMVWAILHDNAVLAWVVDEAGSAAPIPVILGTMGGAGPDTGEIASPAWAVRSGATIFIPDMARGSANEFFNFIATNNGARRPLYAKFADVHLALEFQQWGTVNPALALSAPPNVAPEDAALESQRFGGLTDTRPGDVRQKEAEQRHAERERQEQDETRRSEGVTHAATEA